MYIAVVTPQGVIFTSGENAVQPSGPKNQLISFTVTRI